MNFHYFIRNRLYKIFSFIRKCLHFLFNYLTILFVCLSLYVRFFQKKSSLLSDILCNPEFYHADFTWIFSSVIKCLHFVFQLNSNDICMAIIVFEFFLIFNFIHYLMFSSILWYMLVDKLHYFTKISPFFNCILIVIYAYQCIWGFCKKYSIS